MLQNMNKNRNKLREYEKIIMANIMKNKHFKDKPHSQTNGIMMLHIN